eukprot:COSAG05_NODE_23101_length_260_cov_0.645963_1_plen_36_part_01
MDKWRADRWHAGQRRGADDEDARTEDSGHPVYASEE